MAIEKVIDIKINSNLDNANKSVGGLKHNLKETGTEAKKTTKNVADVSNSTGGINSLGDSLGKLSPTFSAASNGAKGLLKQMWLLVSNPLGATIVAIVGAATLLFKAFTSTKDGADKLGQVMAGLSSIVDVVRDRILNVGNAIVKFFSGDFKGALEEGKKAVSGFGDEVASEFKKAANATKDLQQVEDAFNALSVSRAKVNRDLAISKELLADENASFADKKKALDLIKETEGKQTEQELANARKKFEAIKALNALSDTSREDKKKEQDAEAALFSLQEQSARDRRAINKQENLLLNQKLADEKEAADKRKAIAVEAETRRKENYANEKTALEESLKQEGLNYEQRRNLIKENLNLTAQDRKKFNDEVNKEEKKSIEEHQKAISDLENKYKTAAEDRAAVTALEKLDLERKRAEDEINNIAKTEEEKANLRLLLNADYNDKLKVINLTAQEEKYKQEKEAADKEIALDLAIKNAKRDALDTGLNILMQFAGKNKALALGILAVQKGLAIADIVVGSAKSIASATAALAAVPAVIGVVPNPMFAVQAAATAKGIALTKITAATSIASILASTITSAKGITGGGGGGSTAPSGGAVSGGGATAPQFNVVGNAGTNQLAQTLAGQNQQPLQAYVVSGAVTTAQSLERNIISNASIG